MDSNSKQYWLSITGWLIFTERNERTQFQNLPSCNEIVVLLQTCHALSTHAVSAINSYISEMNKGESWLWKRKMVTHHQQTWFWNWNFKVHFSADEKNLETWLQLHSMSRNYFSFAESEFCSRCWADDVLCSSCIQTSRWCLIIAFSVWIFSETKTYKHQWYQKGSLFLQFWGYMQIEHDDACATSVQTISANHAKVSHFWEAILHPPKLMFFIFLVCSLILSLCITTFIPL